MIATCFLGHSSQVKKLPDHLKVELLLQFVLGQLKQQDVRLHETTSASFIINTCRNAFITPSLWLDDAIGLKVALGDNPRRIEAHIKVAAENPSADKTRVLLKELEEAVGNLRKHDIACFIGQYSQELVIPEVRVRLKEKKAILLAFTRVDNPSIGKERNGKRFIDRSIHPTQQALYLRCARLPFALKHCPL
jgi:hypothetical protein